ncbi:hypothetical protein BASA60_005899 [Batrachochytrium salamandrivorans]|nr:hypothetical protein BASA60_005899 [Batrachochytrium salamandrivorans]
MTGRKGLQQSSETSSPIFRSSPYVFGTLKRTSNPIFKSKFGGQIWAAAKAGSQVKHDEAMTTIAEINCDSAEYLRKLRIQKGGQESHFPVPRFGAVTFRILPNL